MVIGPNGEEWYRGDPGPIPGIETSARRPSSSQPTPPQKPQSWKTEARHQPDHGETSRRAGEDFAASMENLWEKGRRFSPRASPLHFTHAQGRLKPSTPLPASWPLRRAVQAPLLAAVPARRLIGILRRFLLVDVNPQAGLVVRIHVAATKFRCAGEHLAHGFGPSREACREACRECTMTSSCAGRGSIRSPTIRSF